MVRTSAVMNPDLAEHRAVLAFPNLVVKKVAISGDPIENITRASITIKNLGPVAAGPSGTFVALITPQGVRSTATLPTPPIPAGGEAQIMSWPQPHAGQLLIVADAPVSNAPYGRCREGLALWPATPAGELNNAFAVPLFTDCEFTNPLAG